MDFKIGQIVMTKKKHPCGGNQWEILRTGADFRFKMRKMRASAHDARSKFEKILKL